MADPTRLLAQVAALTGADLAAGADIANEARAIELVSRLASIFYQLGKAYVLAASRPDQRTRVFERAVAVEPTQTRGRGFVDGVLMSAGERRRRGRLARRARPAQRAPEADREPAREGAPPARRGAAGRPLARGGAHLPGLPARARGQAPARGGRVPHGLPHRPRRAQPRSRRGPARAPARRRGRPPARAGLLPLGACQRAGAPRRALLLRRLQHRRAVRASGRPPSAAWRPSAACWTRARSGWRRSPACSPSHEACRRRSSRARASSSAWSAPARSCSATKLPVRRTRTMERPPRAPSEGKRDDHDPPTPY